VYLYRAIDQDGQVIDVLVSQKRDLVATRRFFIGALEYGSGPTEVTTAQAPVYPRVIEELIPAACHVTEQYANNRVEAYHGVLKARLRPMRGLKRVRSAPGDQRRARVRPEPPTRPLRTRRGYRSTASAHSDLHGTHLDYLIEAVHRKSRLLPANATDLDRQLVRSRRVGSSLY
jgi:hypothetical protein